jgi:hypothetical protein
VAGLQLPHDNWRVDAAIMQGRAAPLEPTTVGLGRTLMSYGLRIERVYGDGFEVVDAMDGRSRMVTRSLVEHASSLERVAAALARRPG